MEPASVPIEVRGRYFWRGDERFLIRGVVYQDHDSPDAIDAISDDRLEQLEHDFGLFKELGINAIFTYMIDNAKCHDKAMKLLEEAGIYVLATVSTPHCCIHRANPLKSYKAETLSQFFRTADVLAAYPNCLGLIASNELINDHASFRTAPVIRAVVRDLKRYLRLKHEVTGQRVLPVGYSAADVRMLETPTRNYLSAGDEASRVDFWSKNNYSWASPSNMQISGYNHEVEQYSDFNIPTFFSEYGTNINAPRDFGETAAILSPEMTHVFSGGFMYEFWRGVNEYGIVRRVTGKEASKWRRAYNRFEKVSAESISRDMARMTLDEYIQTTDSDGLAYDDNRGRSKKLDRKIAEYRETSVGEIVLYKDFMNLKQRFADMKDVPANTDPDWVDSNVTAARASAFPRDPGRTNIPDVGGEENVPATCVDWQRLVESIRDGEYVLISEEEGTTQE